MAVDPTFLARYPKTRLECSAGQRISKKRRAAAEVIVNNWNRNHHSVVKIRTTTTVIFNDNCTLKIFKINKIQLHCLKFRKLIKNVI